jgi:hypothetical protein
MPKSAGGHTFRGQGNKAPTLAVPPGRQWSEVSIAGELDYQSFPYIGCNFIKDVTPTTDGTNGKLWTFAFALTGSDAIKYYTVEVGSSIRAKKAIDAFGSALTLTLSDLESTISGTMILGKRTDDVTITAGPTSIQTAVVAPGRWDVKNAAAQADLTAASVFPLPVKATITYPSIRAPFFRMNSSDTHYIGVVELPIEPTLSITVGDDDADYAQLLDEIDSGTPTWWRFTNLGATIAGATPSQEKWEIDFCGSLIEPETPEEQDGAALNAFNFMGIYDATATFQSQISNINTLAAI